MPLLYPAMGAFYIEKSIFANAFEKRLEYAILTYVCIRYVDVAQSVEHLTHKEKVAGALPAVDTKN